MELSPSAPDLWHDALKVHFFGLQDQLKEIRGWLIDAEIDLTYAEHEDNRPLWLDALERRNMLLAAQRGLSICALGAHFAHLIRTATAHDAKSWEDTAAYLNTCDEFVFEAAHSLHEAYAQNEHFYLSYAPPAHRIIMIARGLVCQILTEQKQG